MISLNKKVTKVKAVQLDSRNDSKTQTFTMNSLTNQYDLAEQPWLIPDCQTLLPSQPQH